jgi:hypothetical protein
MKTNPHPNPSSATVASSPADSPQAMEGIEAGNISQQLLGITEEQSEIVPYKNAIHQTISNEGR